MKNVSDIDTMRSDRFDKTGINCTNLFLINDLPFL